MYIPGIWASSRRVAVVAAQAIALGLGTTPFMKVLSWSASGFGTAYSDPASPVLNFSQVKQIRFSPANNVIAGFASGYARPDVYFYIWSSSTGFGTKYTNPVGLPTTGDGLSLEFSPAGTDIAFGTEASPFLQVYPWSSGSGFGTKYSNPATLPVAFGLSNAIAFRNTAIVISSYTGSPKIIGYPWTTGVGFGTKYTNPLTDPSGEDRGTKFGSLGTSVIRGSNNPTTSVYQDAYPFNAATGFGTRYANPATALTTSAPLAVNTAGNVVLFGQGYNSAAYPWSPGYGTKFAAPASASSTNAGFLAFNSLDDAVATAGFRNPPQVDAWAWNNASGFGTKFAQPSPSFLGNSFSLTFTN